MMDWETNRRLAVLGRTKLRQIVHQFSKWARRGITAICLSLLGPITQTGWSQYPAISPPPQANVSAATASPYGYSPVGYCPGVEVAERGALTQFGNAPPVPPGQRAPLPALVPPAAPPMEATIHRLPPATSAEAYKPNDVAEQGEAASDEGIWKELKPGKFPIIKLSGFFHLDAGFFDQDETSRATLGDIQNGVGFRRARLQALGSVAEFTNYSVEMDFATAGRPSFFDVWLEQTNLPIVGNVRIGHFRQPFTMTSYTSVRQLVFLERPLPFQAFDPFRRTGIMAYDTTENKNTAWQYSVYRTGGFNEAPLGDSRFGTDIGDAGGYSFATRGTHLLWYDEPSEGRYLLHIGGNAAYSRNTKNDFSPDTPFYQARTIPEFFVGDPAGGGNVAVGTPFFADTGRIPSEQFMIYGAELAGQYGPTYFQSEYLLTTVDQIGGPTLFYDGAYIHGGYFLTGEHRSYNRTFGAFDRVVPFEDFFSVGRGFCGLGAWEVAARLSYVNLNDPNAVAIPATGARPGRMVDSTFGLNWYLNAHTRMQFNWIHCWLDNATFGASDTDIYCARAQVEF
jgi:phosphate-selective porin OprO/OprP